MNGHERTKSLDTQKDSGVQPERQEGSGKEVSYWKVDALVVPAPSVVGGGKEEEETW